ncbi:MAG TPA: caspase family protein [Thermoanaerobaculia bacterium]|nr:caspase family protein [Thermoanaerobaculia bacterium]
MRHPLVLLALALWSARAVAAGLHVCNVEDVTGQGAKVQRVDGRTDPLLPYTPLVNGDRIVIQGSAQVTVRCGSQTHVLTQDKDPVWTAHSGDAPPGRIANLMAWINELFSTAEQHGASVASLHIRGDKEPPSLPLLAGADGAFAAGRTSLALAWTGGAAPYSVRVYRAADGLTVLAAEQVSELRTLLRGKEPVAPGRYELEVRDSLGRTAGAPLEALRSEALPEVPAAFAPNGEKDLVGRTIEAAWLAAHADGRLALEAYQRVAEMALSHDAARRLRDAFEAGLRPTPPPPLPDEGRAPGRALLIGCTRYPNLDPKRWLEGGENDALLMRDLLTGRSFRFDPAKVSVLAGWPADPRLRPTRENIVRQIERLTSAVIPGEIVVLFLAGHGSQEPSDGSPDDPEPDGLDEIFLPADVKGWNGRQGQVENAIRDDEIRHWVEALRGRGALVWLLADACHSGTLLRGAPAEVERERRLPPDLLVPPEVLAVARRHILNDAPVDSGVLDVPTGAGNIVALYASRPEETTPEMRLPDPESPWHGLLTWTVAETLSQSESPLTYRELAERVTARYRAMPRFSPNPMIVGDLDRKVLGLESWPERPRILLAGEAPEAPGKLRVRAGSLLGIRPGSVLRVYPPAGAPQADRALGHVRIVSAGALEALAEPVSFDGLPAPASLPPGSRSSPVFLDYGDLTLKVAVQVQEPAPPGRVGPEPVTQVPGAGPSEIEAALAGMPRLVERVADPARADWFVRQRGTEILLVPASGWPGMVEPQGFAVGLAGNAARELSGALQRIARAHALLAVAGEALRGGGRAERAEEVGVRLDLLRFPKDGSGPGESVSFERNGRILRLGDRVAFRIANPYLHPVDVTLLFIDSTYGIEPFYPRAGEYNRLGPGDSSLTEVFRVERKAAGPEQVVAIAVRSGNGQPVDFSYLAQPALDPARTRESNGSVSALAQLLESALFGTGQARSPKVMEAEGYSISLLSWTTEAAP